MENYYLNKLEIERDRVSTAGKLIVNLSEQNRLKRQEIEKLKLFLAAATVVMEMYLKKFEDSEKAK
jgi:hypothetical protein